MHNYNEHLGPYLGQQLLQLLMSTLKTLLTCAQAQQHVAPRLHNSPPPLPVACLLLWLHTAALHFCHRQESDVYTLECWPADADVGMPACLLTCTSMTPLGWPAMSRSLR
jgi:hypothetical protein